MIVSSKIETEEILMEITGKETKTKRWEKEPSEYHVSDVKKETLERYLRYAEEYGGRTFPSDSPKAVLTSLGLREGDALLNAGAAVFVESGMNALEINHYATDYTITNTYNRHSTGSILTLAHEAVRYVIDSMDWRVEFDGSIERKEFPEVPVSAVQKAVMDAFARRDIESEKAVRLTFFKNFIDIWSPGADRKNNPLIAGVLTFSKMGQTEITDECQKAGVRVEYSSDPSGFTIRFWRHCGKEWAWPANPYL